MSWWKRRIDIKGILKTFDAGYHLQISESLTSLKVGYQKVLRFSWSTFLGIRYMLTHGYLWNFIVSRELKVLKTG